MIIKKSQKLLNFINQRRKKHFKDAGVQYTGDWTWEFISDPILQLHYKDYRVQVLKHSPELVYKNNFIYTVLSKKPPRRVINA